MRWPWQTPRPQPQPTLRLTWGWTNDDDPRYGICGCGRIVRADRVDLILEHAALCPARWEVEEDAA